MEMGLPFRSAHPDVVNNRGLPTPDHFGAHDLAPIADPLRPPFVLWETRLNQSAEDLSLMDDLSNLDEIVEETYHRFWQERQ